MVAAFLLIINSTKAVFRFTLR